MARIERAYHGREAQIHAGGRGKGCFKEREAGEKGGVRIAKSIDDVRLFADQMLNNPLSLFRRGRLPGREAAPCRGGRRHCAGISISSFVIDPRNLPRRHHRFDRGRHGH